MKYLKNFESLNRRTADYNTVYTMNIHTDKNKTCNLIGKIIPVKYGSSLVGYVEDRKVKKFISGRSDWSKVREATQEEINIYNSLEDVNKYNL